MTVHQASSTVTRYESPAPPAAPPCISPGERGDACTHGVLAGQACPECRHHVRYSLTLYSRQSPVHWHVRPLELYVWRGRESSYLSEPVLAGDVLRVDGMRLSVGADPVLGCTVLYVCPAEDPNLDGALPYRPRMRVAFPQEAAERIARELLATAVFHHIATPFSRGPLRQRLPNGLRGELCGGCGPKAVVGVFEASRLDIRLPLCPPCGARLSDNWRTRGL